MKYYSSRQDNHTITDQDSQNFCMINFKHCLKIYQDLCML